MTIEELASYETLIVFRCVGCECVNTAWEGSEKYKSICRTKTLTLNAPCCQNNSCSCHRSGHALQGKKILVGKEAPF